MFLREEQRNLKMLVVLREIIIAWQSYFVFCVQIFRFYFVERLWARKSESFGVGNLVILKNNMNNFIYGISIKTKNKGIFSIAIYLFRQNNTNFFHN